MLAWGPAIVRLGRTPETSVSSNNILSIEKLLVPFVSCIPVPPAMPICIGIIFHLSLEKGGAGSFSCPVPIFWL